MNDLKVVYIETVYQIFIEFNEHYKINNNGDNLALFKSHIPFGQPLSLASTIWEDQKDGLNEYFGKIYDEGKKTNPKFGRTNKKIPQWIATEYNNTLREKLTFYNPKNNGSGRTNPNELCVILGYDSYLDYVNKSLLKKKISAHYTELLRKQLKEFSSKVQKKQKFPLEDEIPIYHWWCYLADVSNKNQQTRGVLCGKLGMYKGGGVLLILERANGKVDKYEGNFEQIHGTVLKISLENNESIITKNEKPEFLFHPREHDFMGIERLRIEYIAGAYIGLNADGAVVMGKTVLQCPKNIEHIRRKKLSELDFKSAHEELTYVTKFELSGRRSIIKTPDGTNQGGTIETVRKFNNFLDYTGIYEAYNVTTDTQLGLCLRKSLFKINTDLMVDCIIKKGGLTNQWKGRVSTSNSDNGLVTLTIFTQESKESNRLYYWKIMLDFSKGNDIVDASYIFSNDTGDSEINIGKMLFVRRKDESFNEVDAKFIEPYSDEFFELDEVYNLHKIFTKHNTESIRSLNSLVSEYGSQLVPNLQIELVGTYLSYYYHSLKKEIVYSVVRIFKNGFVELFTKLSEHREIEIYRGEIRQVINHDHIFSLFLVGGPYKRPLHLTLRLFDEKNIYLHGLYLFMKTAKTRPIAARDLMIKISDDILLSDDIKKIIEEPANINPDEKYTIDNDKINDFFKSGDESVLFGFGNGQFFNNNFESVNEKDEYEDYAVDVFNSGCLIALNDVNKVNYEQVRKKIIKAQKLDFLNIERIKTELQNKESLGRYESIKALFCDIYGFDDDFC